MKKARPVSFGRCPSKAAARQRRHKARRHAGLLVVPVEIHESHLDDLIRSGLLDPAQVGNRAIMGKAVGRAFRRWIEGRGLSGGNVLRR